MAKLVSVPEMLAIEQAADAAGHSYTAMMSHAGQAIVELLNAMFDEAPNVVALVGKGNNGGDALVALAELQRQGSNCTAILAETRQDPLTEQLHESAARLILWSELSPSDLNHLLDQADVFLDALLGTGIQLPLRPPSAEILTVLGASFEAAQDPPLLIAVDCPSGMDCQTGELAPETIAADITISMAAVKEGMLALSAQPSLGELVLGDIGLPPDLKEWTAIKRLVMDQDLADLWLPQRALDAHKGSHGKALVIAGSRAYPGAALLAARSAARSGAGLVSLASHSGLKARFVGHIPEITWTRIRKIVDQSETSHDDAAQAAAFSSLLIGPGLSRQVWKELGLDKLLARTDLPPTVFDAYALRKFAGQENWWQAISSGSVLTPHPGEFAALTGLSTEEVQADRTGLASQYAQQWGQVVLLKGAMTVIAEPGGQSAIVPVANPALASAGTGDVLAGIIAALLAQGLPPFEAACVAAWAHAEASLLASDYLTSTRGILASDLIDFLPEVLV